MQKTQRHALIRRLVTSQAIERQSDFVKALKAEGANVTQATISRDIKELQLIKVPMANGHYRYSLPAEKQLSPRDKLKRTLAASFVRSDRMSNFVHLVMSPGTAAAVGNLIDQLDDPRIFASIAGDAAILIVCRSDQDASAVNQDLDEMVG